MFEHKLYFPNISHALLDEMRDALIQDIGGFTLYHSRGYWEDNDGVSIEPVCVIEAVTTSKEMPRGFNIAKRGLLALGENCVFTTVKEVESELHYE